MVDPSWQPVPQATSIPLLSTEVGCANGQPPEGRAVSMSVTENAATIYISVFIEIPEGDATCPTNPTEALSIPLDEPLGNRQVVDGTSGEVLLDQAGVITTGVPQPASLSITMTGPIVYIEGAVTVLEVTDSDGVLVAPRQFQERGRQVPLPNDDPDFEQRIDNVTIPAGTWQIEIWMLVCSIDTPCTPPQDDALTSSSTPGAPRSGHHVRRPSPSNRARTCASTRPGRPTAAPRSTDARHGTSQRSPASSGTAPRTAVPRTRLPTAHNVQDHGGFPTPRVQSG